MKAFDETRFALAEQAGLILLIDGEVGPFLRQRNSAASDPDHDEHNQTDILTWGLNLAPAFPPRSSLERNSGHGSL
jgi:hypothetical protein